MYKLFNSNSILVDKSFVINLKGKQYIDGAKMCQKYSLTLWMSCHSIREQSKMRVDIFVIVKVVIYSKSVFYILSFLVLYYAKMLEKSTWNHTEKNMNYQIDSNRKSRNNRTEELID